jgi:hypothetical protein
MEPRTYHIERITVTIFGDWTKPVPIVYIHTFQHEGHQIWEECQRLGVQQFYLAEIEGNDWNRDLSPWPAKSMFPDESDFEGKASEWLQKLTSEIIPQIEVNLQITRRIIAGYSLAGLFTLWCTYNTRFFEAAISCSASFWYPDFMDYVKATEFPLKPLAIYLSIGDKESKVKNPIMQQTEPYTRLLNELYKEMGIASIFELNNGNHFMKTDWRVAKGIQWTLRTLKKI